MYGIRACALRLTNTYGPRMRVRDARQTFLGVWIKNLLCGDPIQVFGTGEQLRDFNYVDDVVDAMLRCARSDEANGQVFNLGSEERISLRELADMVVSFKENGRYEIVPFPEDRKAIDIGDYYGNFSKIPSLLNWEPRIALREGLSRAIDYFTQHRSQYW